MNIDEGKYENMVVISNLIIECIQKRADFGVKTSEKVNRLKTTLDIAKDFFRENNLTAAQLTLMKQPNFVKDAKSIFYNDKNEQKYLCSLMFKFFTELQRISKINF